MSDKVAKAVKLNPDQLASPDYVPASSTDIEKKANDLDYLVSQMKMKMQTANRRQKIQILTLTPKSWTLRQAAKEFNVSKATIRKARTLQEQKGIIEMPDQVNGKKLKEHVKLLVKELYNSD